jgi:hypothetical protein
MIATLSQAFASWNSYYGNHQALSVAIRYLHLAALLVGGGTALAIDREIVGLRRVPLQVREAAIARLNRAHALVVASIVFIVVSGFLMAGADVETYLVSPTFWIKMALVVMLLVNGAVLARAGRTSATMSRRITVASIVSAILWLVIVYVSNWLRVGA